MTDYCQNLQQVSWSEVEKLQANSKELRIHKPKKIERLAKSISSTGIFIPIVVNNGNIVAGNARFMAAKLLGLKQVPVIDASSLTEEQLKAYAIADNKFTLDAEWNLPVLQIELADLRSINFDFELTNFEIPEVDCVIQSSTSKDEKENAPEETFVDELNVEKRVISGDLVKLGRHKLFCGNALLAESYNYLMADTLASLVLTDPPYNVRVNGHVCGNGQIKHEEFAMASGEMSEDEFIEFLKTFIRHLIAHSKNGSLAYLFMDWKHSFELLTAGKAYSELKNICVWSKLVGGMGSFYRSQHELVYVFKNGTEKHINNVQLGKYGRNRANVWNYPGVRVSNPENKDDLKFHPTCKPVNLLADAILDASNPGDVVLDCFVGSGSTILACEKSDRVCYAMELEPHYCDVVIHRWEAMSGQKAEIIGNISTQGGLL
jgi:DNA modification methylase